MGGYSSGRKKRYEHTEDLLKLNICQLKKWGYLKQPMSFTLTWSIRNIKQASIRCKFYVNELELNYQVKVANCWEPIKQTIKLDQTACNYGGYRQWFICPNCYKRVGLLYGKKYFFCRHCYNLKYPSQSQNQLDRMINRVDKIREKLKWPHGIINGEGGRPARMRYNNYFKLVHHYTNDMEMVLSLFRKKFKTDLKI